MKHLLTILSFLLCLTSPAQSGILGVVTTPGGAPSGGYTVTTLTQNAAFDARDGIGLVSYGGKLRMMGGWNPDWSPLTTSQQWESADGVTWTQLADAAWNLPRHTFGHHTLDSVIWVWGNDPFNKTDKSVYRYTTATGWQSRGQMDLPGNWVLYQHTIHRAQDGVYYIYIMCGQTGDAPQWGDTFNNAVYRTPIVNGDVAVVGGLVPMEKVCDLDAVQGNRSNATLISYNGLLINMGGGEYWSNGNHTYKGNAIVSADDGATWTTYTNSLFDDQYPNAGVWDGKIWYLKGANKNRSGNPNGNAQGLYYGTDVMNMTRLSGDVAIPARHASTVIEHNGALYIVAGNLWNDAYKITAPQ